jgi:hypothetical protein
MIPKPLTPKEVAQQFCTEYYGAMMTNLVALANFYNDGSSMSYGGRLSSGLKEI